MVDIETQTPHGSLEDHYFESADRMLKERQGQIEKLTTRITELERHL